MRASARSDRWRGTGPPAPEPGAGDGVPGGGGGRGQRAPGPPTAWRTSRYREVVDAAGRFADWARVPIEHPTSVGRAHTVGVCASRRGTSLVAVLSGGRYLLIDPPVREPSCGWGWGGVGDGGRGGRRRARGRGGRDRYEQARAPQPSQSKAAIAPRRGFRPATSGLLAPSKVSTDDQSHGGESKRPRQSVRSPPSATAGIAVRTLQHGRSRAFGEGLGAPAG